MQPKCQHQACSRIPARLRLRPTRGAPSAAVASHALVASRTDPNEAIGKRHGATARPAGAIAWATTSVAPTPRTARRRGPRRGDPRGRPSRDPWGRPSRIQHGFVSFVRGGVPHPCGVPYRPNEAIGKPAWGDGAPCGRDSVGDHKGRPYTRTTRRRGPRRGDPCGRPSRDPWGRPSRIQHGFVSFVRGGVPHPCGVPYRPKRGHRETAWGDGAPCGRDSVGDDKRRPYARNLAARKTWLTRKDGSCSRTLARLGVRRIWRDSGNSVGVVGRLGLGQKASPGRAAGFVALGLAGRSRMLRILPPRIAMHTLAR